MPLTVVQTPPPPPVPPPPPPPVLPERGYQGWYPRPERVAPPPIEILYYTDPTGKVTDFTTTFDEQYKHGVEGRYMPLIQHLTDSVPELDGDRYRGTRAIPRLLTVAVTYIGDDIAAVRARVRNAAAGINPKLGPGTLTLVAQDGVERRITCAYESGLESSVELGGDFNGFTQTVSYGFRAWDPYWYDTSDTVVIATTGQLTTGLFPILPVHLGTSSIFGTWTETNGGDVEAWPVWTINGPGNGLALVNTTTGDTLSLNYTFPHDGSVTIDTRPGVKTVTDQAGANLFSLVSGALWSLAAGDNHLQVALSNAVATTSVRLAYRNRYLGA